MWRSCWPLGVIWFGPHCKKKKILDTNVLNACFCCMVQNETASRNIFNECVFLFHLFLIYFFTLQDSELLTLARSLTSSNFLLLSWQWIAFIHWWHIRYHDSLRVSLKPELRSHEKSLITITPCSERTIYWQEAGIMYILMAMCVTLFCVCVHTHVARSWTCCSFYKPQKYVINRRAANYQVGFWGKSSSSSDHSFFFFF